MNESVFHVGEQAVQARLGVRETMAPWGRKVVRGFLPEEHRAFYRQLPFIVAAARDGEGRPWATLLVGSPGFVASPDERALVLNTRPLEGDALEHSLTAGARLGLLGIELETRRRNRVNGTIAEAGRRGLRFDVGQSFGNCPQYITERAWYEVGDDGEQATVSRHRRLDADMQRWIAAADTFFIASGYEGYGGHPEDSRMLGMDASHRGGEPGFVHIESDTRLVFPDYAGNNHFNTIGNLLMDPRVGLLFVDFERGSLLQITGRAVVDFDSGEIARYPGAQRLVTIDVGAVVRLDDILPLRWKEPRGQVRELRVLRKVRESDDVVSLELISGDGADLPDFEAGQYLPIELALDARRPPVKRTYSLSNGPGRGHYRISVKREPNGLISNLIHDEIGEQTVISARAPAGDFVMTCGERPVVLVSAGIGVTPMMSMLHRLVAQCPKRPVTFVHGARDGAHHVFAGEVRALMGQHASARLHVAYSRPRPEDTLGKDYHRQGRVTAEVFEMLATDVHADYFLCGPVGFMADIATALESRGVDPGRIHTETFGPAAG